MSTTSSTLCGVSLTYCFSFDLPSIRNAAKSASQGLTLSDIKIAGTYDVSAAAITRNTDLAYLDLFKKEMFERRYKRRFLEDSHIFMIEAEKLDVCGLSTKNQQIVDENKIIKVQPIITLNEMGSGTILMWVDLEQCDSLTFAHLFSISRPEDTKCFINLTISSSPSWNLKGVYTLEDIAKFFIVNMMCQFLDKTQIIEVQEAISNGDSIENIHNKTYDLLAESHLITRDLSSYPIFHIDLNKDLIGAHPPISDFVNKYKKEIRGLVSGDINWEKKSGSVVENFIADHNFSTRDSIAWFTHPEGSLKIYSKNMETSVQVSKILIAFEIETIISMKQFLYKIIYNITVFSKEENKRIPLRKIAKIRDKEMRRLDGYYNLDLLHKDTTARRLLQFRELLRVDTLFLLATQKLESLDVYMTMEFQNASTGRQLTLTVLFGAFGAGQLSYMITQEALRTGLIYWGIWTQILVTMGVMVAVGIVISRLFGRLNIR